MIFQRHFFFRFASWRSQTLLVCKRRVNSKPLAKGAKDGIPLELPPKCTGADSIHNLLFSIRSSSLQSPITPWYNRSSVYKHSVFPSKHYNNVQVFNRAAGLKIPGQNILEMVFPFQQPTKSSIGDCECEKLIIGDDVTEIPSFTFSSILKKRHKKMNKHKYRKRRQRDVFKRRHLENIRLRKQRTKEQKEQRRQEREGHS